MIKHTYIATWSIMQEGVPSVHWKAVIEHRCLIDLNGHQEYFLYTISEDSYVHENDQTWSLRKAKQLCRAWFPYDQKIWFRRVKEY